MANKNDSNFIAFCQELRAYVEEHHLFPDKHTRLSHNTTPLEQDFGFRPSTPLRDGLRAFAQWYAKYYGTCEK